MSRLRFFNKKYDILTLKEILAVTGGKILDDADLNVQISDVATLDDASSSDISFLTAGSYLDKFLVSKAGVILMEERYQEKAPKGCVAIIHENPYYAYSLIAGHFYEEKKPDFSDNKKVKIGQNCQIAPSAHIGNNVEVGANSIIGPGAVIMDGVIIGNNAQINANAVVSFAVIGKNAIIHNGAKIGQDGFGFAHDKGINHKIIQLGIVEIGDDFEIGANACIDRGAIKNTKIGNQVKLDNLVQIGHNVEIDMGTVIAGATVVAGSTKIGKFVQIGGNGSITGHIEIGDGCKIAGMSGVTKSLDPMSTVAGIPAVPIRNWHKMHSALLKMIGGSNKI